MTTAAPASLYERLGGVAAISAAVDDFYGRVTADPRLAGFFDGTDMATLRRHQVAMLSAATGGPNEYRGRIMAEAHAGRSITDEHFDAVVGHLVETLQSLGVDDHTIGEVGAALLSLRADIVTAQGEVREERSVPRRCLRRDDSRDLVGRRLPLVLPGQASVRERPRPL